MDENKFDLRDAIKRVTGVTAPDDLQPDLLKKAGVDDETVAKLCECLHSMLMTSNELGQQMDPPDQTESTEDGTDEPRSKKIGIDNNDQIMIDILTEEKHSIVLEKWALAQPLAAQIFHKLKSTCPRDNTSQWLKIIIMFVYYTVPEFMKEFTNDGIDLLKHLKDQDIIVLFTHVHMEFFIVQYGIIMIGDYGQENVLEAVINNIIQIAEESSNSLPMEDVSHILEKLTSLIVLLTKSNPQLSDYMHDHRGQNTLIHLCSSTSNKPNEILLSLVPLFMTPVGLISTDYYGKTALHYVCKAFFKFTYARPKLQSTICSLTTPRNVNIRDWLGRTALHYIAKGIFKNPEKIKEVLPLLITTQNVNGKDENSTTPYSWLLLAKLKWQDDPDKLDLVLHAEEKFIQKDADANLATAGLVSPILHWILGGLNDKEHGKLNKFTDKVNHFDSKWTMSQLGILIWELNVRVSSKQKSFMKKIIGKVIMKSKNKTSLLNDIISTLEDNFSIHLFEILSNAAVDGLEFKPLENFLLLPKFLIRSDELTEHFLKIILSTNISPDQCDLDFLGSFYKISKEIIELGRKVVHHLYKTWEECLYSRKLINCFLFIRDIKISLSEEFVRESHTFNWLGRNPIHLAVIFLENLECLPDSIIKEYIRARDIHCCSPLHVASLHQNERAVKFLLKCGYDENDTDNFGLTHREIGQVHSHEALYDEQCCRITEATEETDQLLDHLKPLLILPETEAERLTEQLQELFRRLIKETPFSEAKIQIGGSLREKLKSGRLDEGDVQICLPGYIGRDNKVTYYRENIHFLIEQLSDALVAGLSIISWEGIYLRPVNVSGPWELIWEGDDLIRGMQLSLDVVLIIFDGKDNYVGQLMLKEMLDGAPFHDEVQYQTLEPWNKRKQMKQTFCAYEWDMLDSLPTAYRLAIVIAKALVQAYYRVRGDHLHSEMPITSYTIKTALFYILGHHSGDLTFGRSKSIIDALNMSAIETGDRCGEKMKFNPNAKWLTGEDLCEHGDEARIRACRIFSFIKTLGKLHVEVGSFNYWEKFPIEDTKPGENEYSNEICDYALKKLDELKISMQKKWNPH